MKYNVSLIYHLNNATLQSLLNNFTILQFFEWNLPNNGTHWNTLKDKAKELNELGLTSVWIPPPYKGGSINDVGYGVYDIWDLGEFDQKGTVRTKYGTKQELINAIKSCKKYNITIYSDIVLNHKMWADASEEFSAVEVNPTNRNQQTSDAYNVTGWTQYDFKGREGKYSQLQWNFTHFTGIDYNQNNGQNKIFKITGPNKLGWSNHVDMDLGNFDYLMGSDIDFRHPDVIEDLNKWGVWMVNTLQLGGFRLDAVKHIDSLFMKNWIRHINSNINDPKFFVVGEYWKSNVDDLSNYIHSQDGVVRLFDVPLHYNFHEASVKGSAYDLSKIFDNTLTQKDPVHAVTFVDNHDTQPGQSLNSWVEDWFKPHAYALILLRDRGYPCVFYGDLYGISGPNPIPSKYKSIQKLLFARNRLVFGQQIDYFDHSNTVGWTRLGVNGVGGLAAILSNSQLGWKWMYVGHDKVDQVWIDLLGHYRGEVIINSDGYGLFNVNGGSISVYAKKENVLNISLRNKSKL